MKRGRQEERIRLPARASLAYGVSGAVCKAIGLSVTPFFTRLQSESDYGAFTLYMSVLGAVSVISSAVSSGSSVYKGLTVFRERKADYLSSLLAASLGFSGVICILLFAFSGVLGIGYGITLAICLQLLCDSIVGVRMTDARFHYRYKEVGIISIFESLGSALTAIFILSSYGGGYTVRIFSMLLVSLSAAVYALLKIVGRGRARSDMTAYNLKSSLPLIPHSIESALSGQADKLIFTAMLGTTALARYSVVHSLGIGLAFLVGALGSALNPWIIRRLNAGEEERIGEICAPIFKGLSAATVFLIALAPEVMRILAPPEYSEAIVAILPIALSVLPSLVISLGTLVLINSEKGGRTAYASIVTLMSGILLNLILIPHLRYFGAGLSLLFSQILGAAVTLYFLKKSSLADILPIRRIIYYFSLAVLLGSIALLLYSYPAVRILLLSFPAVLLLGSLFSAERLVRE